MRDQMHVAPVVPVLSALREHPDFQEGLCHGQQAFQDGLFEEQETAWTEEDIIELVEGELSSKRYRREQRIDQVMGWPSLSYLHHLGFALSYLDQALAASAQ